MWGHCLALPRQYGTKPYVRQVPVSIRSHFHIGAVANPDVYRQWFTAGLSCLLYVRLRFHIGAVANPDVYRQWFTAGLSCLLYVRLRFGR
jgi:hypothetical protein